METNEDLVIAYQNGNGAALSTLCEKNRGLVANVARGFRGEIDDLFQAGMMGLVEAAKRFDPERGARFSTYASSWIFARCVTCAKEMNGVVHVNGREGRRVLNLIGRVKRELAQSLGRDPTLAEISKEMGIEQETVASVVGVSSHSLNSTIDDENRTSLSEVIPDEKDTPDRVAESLDIRRAVRAFADTIKSDSEKFVFLNVLAGDMTNEQAGQIRGVSRQRINQLVVRLRPRFKRYAEEIGLGPNP